MRINPANSSPVQSGETSGAKKSDKVKATPYDKAQGNEAISKKTDSASAEISSKAKDMAQAKQVASDSPDVREAKIAELREKIQNKKYNVSSEQIADRLVDDHIRMTGA